MTCFSGASAFSFTSKTSTPSVASAFVRALPKTTIGFLPASYLSNTVSEEEKARLRAKYGLPAQFLFYPAQFWQHKNHRGLFEALKLLGDEAPLLVLTGSPVKVCSSGRKLAR